MKGSREKMGLLLIIFIAAISYASAAGPELDVEKGIFYATTEPGVGAIPTAVVGDEILTSGMTDLYLAYKITISNTGDEAAELVTVTDKLPPGLEYVATYLGDSTGTIGAEMDETTDPKLINEPQVNGDLATDLVGVQIEEIVETDGTVSFWIVTQVSDPTDTPQILYNNVFTRASNSDDNLFDEVKVILMSTYDRYESAKSFEFLLKNQSHLLLSFEDLLHPIIDSDSPEATTDVKANFAVSFEQLLDQQASLLDSFEETLYGPGTHDWYWEDLDSRIDFLLSFEELLKKEAFLFASFEDVVKKLDWTELSIDQQKEFASSFEKLLHEEMTLFSSYENLFKRLDLVVDACTVDTDCNGGTCTSGFCYYSPNYVPSWVESYTGMAYDSADGLTAMNWNIVLLGSFEYMLRIQANLLSSFEDFLMESAPILSCGDGQLNGTETDTDCGGDCDPCADGQYCLVPSDCQSGVCSGTPPVCQVPTCEDGVQNGEETGVDCGGSVCPACT